MCPSYAYQDALLINQSNLVLLVLIFSETTCFWPQTASSPNQFEMVENNATTKSPGKHLVQLLLEIVQIHVLDNFALLMR